jgi:hypothetical protein
MDSAYCMFRLISGTILRQRDYACLETVLGHIASHSPEAECVISGRLTVPFSG